MNTVISETKTLRQKFVSGTLKQFLSKAKAHSGLLLIALMFIGGCVLSLICKIPVKSVMSGYSYDVLVILIVMELFTNLICATGIMEFSAVKIAELSKGKKRLCLIMFGTMMFFISSLLNNITAVMMVLPIIFVMLKSIETDRRYINIFFAALLALSNTGGAASPVGDFPAITILTSGITNFISYLTHAFPLFAFTSAALILFWSLRVKKEPKDDDIRDLAINCLKSRYKNIEVRFDALKPLMVIFAAMFAGWSFIPQSVIPPEIIAILGYTAAAVICAAKGIKVEQNINLKSVLTIASFLFFAAVVSKTGVLELLAVFLQNNISNPKLLILAVMLITSFIAGIVGAGPAAAATLPIVIQLCSTSFPDCSDWIAVAFASAICAGSSLFMWSATAGFIFSEKVEKANIPDENNRSTVWGVVQYLRFGLVNYLIQISIAVIVISLVL